MWNVFVFVERQTPGNIWMDYHKLEKKFLASKFVVDLQSSSKLKKILTTVILNGIEYQKKKTLENGMTTWLEDWWKSFG